MTFSTSNKARSISLAILVAVASGCGSAPVQHEITNAFDFAGASYSDVWSATVAALNSENLAPESTDQDTGVMSTGWVGLPEANLSYADCGDAGVAHSFRNLEANVNPVLERDGETATLTINTRFRADRWEGGLAQRVVEEDRTCFSTGELEQVLRDRIRDELRGS